MSTCNACLCGSGSHNPECYHSVESVQKRSLQTAQWQAGQMAAQASASERQSAALERIATALEGLTSRILRAEIRSVTAGNAEEKS